MRTDLGEGDDSFIGPREALCIEIKFFRADPYQEHGILSYVIKMANFSGRKFWLNLSDPTYL